MKNVAAKLLISLYKMSVMKSERQKSVGPGRKLAGSHAGVEHAHVRASAHALISMHPTTVLEEALFSEATAVTCFPSYFYCIYNDNETKEQ